MTDFTAIILAAGRGLRMGARGKLTPKGLLRLGERTLVEESVITLRTRGISHVRIVTGHLAHAYRQETSGWGYPVELRDNAAYAQTGSLRSLMVGLEGHEASCVILESDLAYEPRALDPVAPEQSRLIVSGTTGAGDEVYVWADAGADGRPRLRDMSKDRQRRPETHYGELAGITCLSSVAVGKIKRLGTELLLADPRADYESALIRLTAEEDIICHRIDTLAWAEIDDEAMFSRAAQSVYPKILSARSERQDSGLRGSRSAAPG